MPVLSRLLIQSTIDWKSREPKCTDHIITGNAANIQNTTSGQYDRSTHCGIQRLASVCMASMDAVKSSHEIRKIESADEYSQTKKSNESKSDVLCCGVDVTHLRDDIFPCVPLQEKTVIQE